LCSSYGVQPDAALIKAAQDSYAACVRSSFSPTAMKSDLAPKASFNIYSGDYET
jgi:hypothetical protein